MEAPWMEVAESFIGVKELPGKKNNFLILRILRGMKNLGRRALGREETPWCSAFVNHVFGLVGIKGTEHALARSWTTWGVPAKPDPGAVIVIKAKHKAGRERVGSRAGYHVGFLKRIQRHYYVILGGNQRNQVRVSHFPKSRYELVALRKPSPST